MTLEKLLQSTQACFVLPLAVCRNVSRSMQHRAARQIHVPGLHMVSLGVFINALWNTTVLSLFAVRTNVLFYHETSHWIQSCWSGANHNSKVCSDHISSTEAFFLGSDWRVRVKAGTAIHCFKVGRKGALHAVLLIHFLNSSPLSFCAWTPLRLSTSWLLHP